MWTLLLTVCCLTYAAKAKSLSERIDARSVADDFDGELSTFNGGEYFYTKTIRQPRLSDTRPAKPATAARVTKTSDPKVPLVKKPIPKFTDGGSEEDYLAKLRFPNRVLDSVELEDEDFSVDDYDFDVDHDEFASRGKPLQPRVKAIRPRPKPAKVKKARPAPALRQIEKAMPHDSGKPSVKVVRKVSTDKMKDEEYDEEFTAGTKSMEKYKKSNGKDDTSSDDPEESKEDSNKQRSRTARSSPTSFVTYDNKLGEKKGEFPKMLSFLPLFSLSHATLDVVQEKLTPKTVPGFIQGLVSRLY